MIVSGLTTLFKMDFRRSKLYEIIKLFFKNKNSHSYVTCFRVRLIGDSATHFKMTVSRFKHWTLCTCQRIIGHCCGWGCLYWPNFRALTGYVRPGLRRNIIQWSPRNHQTQKPVCQSVWHSQPDGNISTH